MKITIPHRGRSYQINELENKLLGLKSIVGSEITSLQFDDVLYKHLITLDKFYNYLGES